MARRKRIEYAPDTGNDEQNSWLERLVTQLNQDTDASSVTVDILGTIGDHPDRIPDAANRSDWDDEFEGTVVYETGARFSGAEAWTWQNQGGTTASLANGHIILTTDPADGNPNVLTGIYQTPPTAPWTFRSKMCMAIPTEWDFIYGGISLENIAAGKFALFAFAGDDVQVEGSGGYYANGPRGWAFRPWYFEVENDGTLMNLSYSATGVIGSFTLLSSANISSTLGGDIDRIGLALRVYGGNAALYPQRLIVEWWRRVA